MSRLFTVAAAVTILVLPALALARATPAPTPTPSVRVILTGGTPMNLQVVDKVSSGNAQVGDTFALKTTQDVVIDGWVVIVKGAAAQGEVVSVERAGSHGKAGKLGIQLDWIYAVDGDKVKLTAQRKTSEGENKSGTSSTLTVASWILLGPIGLFTHNWVKGHELELNPENTAAHPLQGFVDSNVYVTVTERSDAGPGFAPAAPLPNATVAPTSSPTARPGGR